MGMVKTSFGVSMSPELARRVEGPLSYGDTRSERVRDLVRLGLCVEDSMQENGVYTPDPTAQKQAVRDAFDCLSDCRSVETGSGVSVDGCGPSCSE